MLRSFGEGEQSSKHKTDKVFTSMKLNSPVGYRR